MYSWTALVTAQILVEVPWNILGSTLYFLTWYWTSQFPTERAGYAYLGTCVLFPIYYTTVSQAIASMASTAEVAAILFGFLFSFVITFNGVVQPFRELGWWKWMYHLSPFTYFVEGLTGAILGRQTVTCSAVEIVRINPPVGQSCGQYMAPFISFAGGYLNNPNALTDCEFCGIQGSDQFLEFSFNIFYNNRWKDLGAIVGFIGFNIVAIYVFTYLFRIHTGSFLPFPKKAKKQT
jgi:ATP-binding cassette subfamily G (WHITE) protein 2 (SNQ2)